MHAKSNLSEHSKCLKDRLSKWKQGNIEILLDEGCAIQQRHCTAKRASTNKENLVRLCAPLVEEGKVMAALKLLSNNSNSNNGTLLLGDTLDDGMTVNRIFNPFAASNQSSLKFVYERHEREKCRAYEQLVINIEHESLTPCTRFLSVGVGKGPTAQVAYTVS